MGQRAQVDDCVLINEQHWGEEYPSKNYDCGYETTYRIKSDTLKITIRHQGGNRGRKSTAVAAVRCQGTLTWKTLYELHGARIKSRDKVQYREKQDYNPPNAHLFHKDEQEPFETWMLILPLTQT
jgi:hypothetical protein